MAQFQVIALKSLIKGWCFRSTILVREVLRNHRLICSVLHCCMTRGIRVVHTCVPKNGEMHMCLCAQVEVQDMPLPRELLVLGQVAQELGLEGTYCREEADGIGRLAVVW